MSYVTMTVEAEIDMSNFDTYVLEEELERRNKKAKRKPDFDHLKGPINNLDFRMKLELFLEVWENIPFTELQSALKNYIK